MSVDTGGPAFPVMSDVSEYGFVNYHHACMTLRDYFAAKAVQGLMGRDWSDFKGGDSDLAAQWAKSAYLVADAMLKARQ